MNCFSMFKILLVRDRDPYAANIFSSAHFISSCINIHFEEFSPKLFNRNQRNCNIFNLYTIPSTELFDYPNKYALNNNHYLYSNNLLFAF